MGKKSEEDFPSYSSSDLGVCVCVCKTTQLRHVAIVVVDDFPVRFIHVVNLILQL